MLFRAPGGSIELACFRMRPKAVWQDGEAAALLLAVRAACRSSLACPAHWVLAMAVRNCLWHTFAMGCLTTGAGPRLTARLLSRVALLFESAPILEWRTAAEDAAAHLGGPHPAMLPELGPALYCLRRHLVRISDRAGEILPWSPPVGLALWLSAHVWELTIAQAHLAQFLLESSGYARPARLEASASSGGHRLAPSTPYAPSVPRLTLASLARATGLPAALLTLPRLPPSSPYAQTVPRLTLSTPLQQPAHPTAVCQPPPEVPAAGIASRTRQRVGRDPQPLAARGLAPVVGSFYQTAHLGVVYVVAVLDHGVLCGFVARDESSDQDSDTEEEGLPLPPPRVDQVLCSRHGFICWSPPLSPEDAPMELRDAAVRWDHERATREDGALCASLAKDLRPGGRLARQPTAHGMERNPLLMGHPPPGFRLLLLPRQRLSRGFMTIVGCNPGPRRELSALQRDALRMWRLEACVGGCATFVNLRKRVRTHLERLHGPVKPGLELRMRLSPEEAAALLAYGVTPTLVRHRGRHLVLFPGSSAPQFLGVEGAAALMGVTATSAGPGLEWLLRLANGGVQLPGALQPIAPATGTLRAVEMLGSAIQLDVAALILRHADSLVMASEDRLTLAEHFAGLGLATWAATRVWPGARPLFFSDSCSLARHCLRCCWPKARVCDAAESKESLRCFPKRVFSLIAGFPCNLHSGLAHGVAFSDKLSSLDILFLALEPLRWGEDAPTIVLLENTSGILPGAFLALCARLLTTFGEDYHWSAGVACPSLHADVPTSRLRVYLLAVHKQRATDPSSWPVLEGSLYYEALMPIPMHRGVDAQAPGDQDAAPALVGPEGQAP